MKNGTVVYGAGAAFFAWSPVLRSWYFLVGAGAGAKDRLPAPAPPKIKQTKLSMIFSSLVLTLIKAYTVT